MENKLHILLCEDEESLGMLVREYLQAKGYDAELYLDGEAGYKAFMRTKFDMCLLDVMMPKMDGFTLAREIRMVNARCLSSSLLPRILRMISWRASSSVRMTT